MTTLARAAAAALLALTGCTTPDRVTDDGRPQEAPRAVGDTTSEALLAAGEAAYFAGQYDSARYVLEQVLSTAGVTHDSVSLAHALTWLGLTAWRQGRYADARRLQEQALELKRRQAMRHDLFRSHNALGLLANSEGRYADAVTQFTHGLHAARAVADSTAIARALGNLGLPYFELGDFDKARVAFTELQTAAEATGDVQAQGAALTNLALLDIRLGDGLRAIELLERARALHAEANSPVGEENALGQLGTAYAELGDPQRAIAYLDSALTLARRHQLKEQEIEDLQLLALVFSGIGDHTRALEHLGRARALSVSLGPKGRLGSIARAEASSYAAAGREDLALASAREALELHRAAGSRMEQLLDQLTIAELAQRSGSRRDADRALAAAVTLARTLDVAVARAHLVLGRARVADLAADAAAVHAALRESRPDLSRLGPGGEWEALALEARAYARQGRMEEAVESGSAAVAALEQVRDRITAGPLRTSFTAERAAVYSDLVLALLRLDRAGEAFAVADAARSRALLEHIAAAGSGSDRAGPQLAESERILRRIDWLMERLQQVDTVPEQERSATEYAHASALAARLASARREYEYVLQRAMMDDPRGVSVLGGATPPLGDVQAALMPGDVLLQFFVAPERLITFALTHDRLVWVEVPVTAADLTVRARLAHDIASRPSVDTIQFRPLAALDELLIEPVRRTGLLRGARTLTIVPHASLVHVPFAALIGPSGRYLVQDHALMMVPSASALPAMRGVTRRAGRRAAIFAPFPDRLPASRVEAAAVSRSLRLGTRKLGRGADEPTVRRALGEAGIVHIASHGILNESSPMFSRIELAAPAQRVPGNDGRLEVHELLSMNVRSHLVFLSGCETAAGVAWSNSFRRGQDYATLAQAFLYAGARDVIATLWRIDDRGAAVFAESFYRSLRSRGPAEALAEAQRATLNDPRYAAPRYWAGYTLSGAGGEGASSSPTAASVQLTRWGLKADSRNPVQ